MAQVLLDLIIISVTAEEKAVIDKLRQEKAQKKRAADLATEFLTTAADYHKWLTHTGNGDSYSTFCNDFEYERKEHLGASRDVIHTHVMNLIVDARASAAESVSWEKAFDDYQE